MRQLISTVFRTAAIALAIMPSLCAAAPATDEPKSASLQPNFTPGYTAKVIMETSRKSTRVIKMGEAEAKPQESSTSGEQTIEFLLNVVRNDEKGSVVTLRVDRIEMDAKTIRGEFAWKSTDPRTPGDNTNVALSTMRPALGSTITIEFDAEGNVTNVGNGGVQMPTGEIVDFFRLAVGPAEVRARWSPVLAPRKGDFKVDLGQKWTGEEKLNTPPLGQFTEAREYVLSSISDRLAVINFTGNYTLGAGPDGQAPMFRVIDSAVTGSIHWDRTIGFFESMELNQRVELQGNANGFPIGFRTETSVKIRREAVSPPKAE